MLPLTLKAAETVKARMDAKMRAKPVTRGKACGEKAERERHTDPNESVPVFWEKFNSKEERVYKFADDKLQLKSASNFDGDLNSFAQFDQVYDKIDEIQEMLAAAVFFCQDMIAGYLRKISNAQS